MKEITNRMKDDIQRSRELVKLIVKRAVSDRVLDREVLESMMMKAYLHGYKQGLHNVREELESETEV